MTKTKTTSAEWKGKLPEDYPLSSHKKGWCKRIKGLGVVVICNHLSPMEALKIWGKREEELIAKGQAKLAVIPEIVVPATATAPTITLPVPSSPAVMELKEKYMEHKRRELDTQQFDLSSYDSTQECLEQFVAVVNKPIAALTIQDFVDYRYTLASRFQVNALDRHITQVRAMFNWAAENYVIDSVPRWGKSFEKPSMEQKRKHAAEQQHKHGEKLFTPEQVRTLIKHAGPSLKAMVLLGINCGIGNSDIARMPIGAIDIRTRILDFPRPKTGIARRAILWSETIAAIKEVLSSRKGPEDSVHENLLFINSRGAPWVIRKRDVEASGRIKPKKTDLLSQHFQALKAKAGIPDRQGLGFYSLRHTYRTLVDDLEDENAKRRTMGHELLGMAKTYVRVSDDRLKRASNYVHRAIFGKSQRGINLQVISTSNPCM